MRSALQFLTIIPVRASEEKLGNAAWAFPIVGALLGLTCAAILPLKLGPVIAITTIAFLTGGLHEDGLADVCDAIRKHRSRERMHQILKDSRIGAHGALALIASFLIRWQALAMLAPSSWLSVLAVYGLSRAVMALLAAISLPSGDGLGAVFVSTMPPRTGILVGLQALGLAALTGWPVSLLLLAANGVLLFLVRKWFSVRLGGVTGDCLGFTCLVSESISLAIIASASVI
jgi:adenosylcobinamide-GDP ribazoletransferase